MRDRDDAEHAVREVAGQLAGSPVRALVLAHAGANSQIFQVDTGAGRFALKRYPVRQGDTRSRADVEWKALHFLSARCGSAVPKPVARDAAGEFLLMEWIEGTPLKVHRLSDVMHATDFVGRVFAHSGDPEAAAFPPASEACLSAGIIVAQIEQRLALLGREPAVDGFVAAEVLPALGAARRGIPAADEELAPNLRRLIPSDFGFHNAMRQPDGGLRYFDFDYFGWDDPVKLVADFLLHPAMRLSDDDKHAFVRGIAPHLPDDTGFGARLRSRLPLFALRWVMILFNPFRRDRAGELAATSRQALIEDRLGKARTLLGSIPVKAG